jgi:hypothetical protein
LDLGPVLRRPIETTPVLDTYPHSLAFVGSRFATLLPLQKFDTPLEQATTPSLEALKAYSVGYKTFVDKGDAACIPFLKRAIELDPNSQWVWGFHKPISKAG